MERYCISVDKVSQIKNDSNGWASDQKKRRYSLEILLTVINVSIQFVDIINPLPHLKFDNAKEN